MIVTQDKNKNKYKNDLITVIEGFENKFVDFNKERLVPQMFSNEGPAITSSDLNNDNVPAIITIWTSNN